MDKIKIRYWLVILAVALVGINITYPGDFNVPRFNSNIYYSILFTLWAVMLYVGMQKGKIQYILKYDWIIGFIFSSLYCATFVVSNVKLYLTDGVNLFLTAFSWISWMIMFTVSFTYIRKFFGIVIPKEKVVVPKTLYIWLLLALIWFISIVWLLPGQISWDGLKQFCEFDRTHLNQLNFTYSPTNHHPWFTTVIFGLLFNLGRSLFGVNFGVFTVVIFQFIVSSLIYTFVIKYVWTKIGKIGGIISFLLFASPIFSSYAVTIDKSTLYYAFSAWFYLSFTKLYENIKDKNWKYIDIISYIISSTLAGLFRNDAFLIVVITTGILIAMTLMEKQKLIFILCSFGIILGVHMGWNAFLNKENVIKSSPSEALTIPIRQLSYVYITDPKYFNKTELKTINEITNISEIKNKYDINNGDSLKSLYPSDTFLNSADLISDVVNGKKTLNTTSKEKKATINYLKLWLITGLKHPCQYFRVYLEANSRYLNPFILYDAGLFLNYYPPMPNFLHPSWFKEYYPLFSNNVRDVSRQILMMIAMFPPLAIIVNPATLVWLALILLFMLIIWKDWRGIMFLLPLIIMCMLFTVTSINGYTRYTIGALAALPIVITYLWQRRYNSFQTRKEK